MMTLLGIAGLLFIVWAVRSVGRHSTQDEPFPLRRDEEQEHPVAPSVSKARQQYVNGRRLTDSEREALADLRAERLAERNHDARMAAAAGVAGVVAGAALAHHHDAVAQHDALAQTVNYDSGDGFDGDDVMYADTSRDDGLYEDTDAYGDDDTWYQDDDAYADVDDAYDDSFGGDNFDHDDFGDDDFDI